MLSSLDSNHSAEEGSLFARWLASRSQGILAFELCAQQRLCCSDYAKLFVNTFISALAGLLVNKVLDIRLTLGGKQRGKD